MYVAFKRTWWKKNPDWPDGLEPFTGQRKYFDRVFETENEARTFCRQWNKDHNPGLLSMKAEYTKITKRSQLK